MTEIIQALSISNDEAGLVNTSLFLVYGAGQIVSGIMGDHIAPRKMIFAGLVASGICNILLPFMPNIILMTILWGINGFAQALFWPPLVRMMAEHLDKENYNRACVCVSMGSSSATIVIYLFSSLCIFLSGWETIFLLCGAFGLLVSVLWLYSTRNVDKITAEKEDTPAEESAPEQEVRRIPIGKLVVISGMVPILICIILMGMLRDGLDSWMPTLISDTFNLSSVISILTGMIMPLFGIVCFRIASSIQKKLKNEMVGALLFFGIACACSLLLLPLYNKNVIVSVLLIAVTTGCMHGVNLILIQWVPRYFAKYGKIATFSGIMNAFTYMGSAVSMYGFGALSEWYGWYFTIGTWIVIALTGAVLAAINIRRWTKFSESE